MNKKFHLIVTITFLIVAVISCIIGDYWSAFCNVLWAFVAFLIGKIADSDNDVIPKEELTEDTDNDVIEDCLEYAKGADLIREERRRQQEVEGYDAMHDRHHTPQVLCRAAAAYALYDDQSALIGNSAAKLWPWSNEFWKPKTQLRNLVRAGALIAAAIDKLQSEKGE